MNFKKGHFIVSIGYREVDLSELDADEWANVETFISAVLDQYKGIDKHKACCAGFLAYISEMSEVYDFMDSKTLQKVH